MKNSKQVGIIALSSLKGLGPAFVKKVVSASSFETDSHFKEIKEITAANRKQIDDDAIFKSIENAEMVVFRCKEESVNIVDITNDNYPSLLKQLKDPPSVIYLRGKPELLYEKTMCIIGTREPNANGIKIAERVGLFFASANWVICNGLAEGVDNFVVSSGGSVHRKVIGVLAGGLNYDTSKLS